MSERPESDNKQLLFPLVILRRLDAEFRSGGKQSVHWTFLDEYKKLNAIIDTMTNASKVKGEVGTPVKAYADAFEGWIASANKVAYFGPVIIEESKVMATPADRIIASADERTGRASSMLASSQAKNRNIIVAVSTDTELLDRPWHHSAALPAHQRHGSARCRRL